MRWLAATVVVVVVLVLASARVRHLPDLVYGKSRARAEVLTLAIEAYCRDVGHPPPTGGGLSRALFGDNRSNRVYLQASEFPTNGAGLFLDAARSPYQIMITGNTIRVVGMGGNVEATSVMGESE
jgi:hypothetical protein